MEEPFIIELTCNKFAGFQSSISTLYYYKWNFPTYTFLGFTLLFRNSYTLGLYLNG